MKKTNANINTRIVQRRVVVYIPEEDYRSLRAKLILLGKSVSQWFREIVKSFLSS